LKSVSVWDRRIARAGELVEKQPAAAELLRFYQGVARFQKSVYEKLARAEGHEPAVLLAFLPELISLVRQTGSTALQQTAEALGRSLQEFPGESKNELLQMLTAVWQHQEEPEKLSAEMLFFLNTLLQPYAEYLAQQTGPQAESAQSLCPFCGSRPQLAVLKPEGDGGKRFLVCSLCSTEWTFRRVLCPGCGEEHKDRLPIFVAKEFDHVRIDACDTCHTYIKSIDLTKDGLAVPVVDELATVSLNLWAEENKYRKLSPNLFGV